MLHVQDISPMASPSPMILSDRLLSLAQEAERAGCILTAEHLLTLAHTVFDDRLFGGAQPLRQ